MINDYLKQYFYSQVDENIKDFPNVDEKVVHTEKFMSLCQKFVDISLKAPKFVEPGTTELHASFQYKDMDVAKRAFLLFCDQERVEDRNSLLDFIRVVSPWSVNHDNTASGTITNQKSPWEPVRTATYYDTTVLPDEIWDYLKEQITGMNQAPTK